MLTVLLKAEKVLGDVVYARIKQGVEAGARAALGAAEKRGRWLDGDHINESPKADSAGRLGGQLGLSTGDRSSKNSGDIASVALTAEAPVSSTVIVQKGVETMQSEQGENSKKPVSCQHFTSLLDLPLETRPAVDPSRTGHPLRSVDGRGLLLPLSLGSLAQSAEAAVSKSVESGFESQASHQERMLVPSLSFTFDATNPRALSWASLRSSALITEISEDTRTAARDLVRHGIEEGVAPRKLAQQVRESIGLRTDQVEAVDNLIKEIRAAQPGQLITRFPAREGVRSQPGFRVKAPSKVTEKWLSQQRARYSRMQLNHRARMIARSESLHSANQGQKELWLQARDANQLPKDQKRMLIVTPDERLRKAHSGAAGQIVGIDEPFDMGDGTTEPGQAVACRCGQSLV